MGVEEFIPFFPRKQVTVERRDPLRTLQDRVRLYETILSRYRSLIEREEAKTIVSLKAVIVPNDEVIQRIRAQICKQLQPYIYAEKFLAAARAAHEFVRTIRTITIPIDFWLTPREFLELRGGDPMDKATFLCSLLIALENQNSYVIVGSGKGTKVAVGCTFEGVFYIFDPMSEHTDEGDKNTILERWFGDCERIYEFNNVEYNEIKGGE